MERDLVNSNSLLKSSCRKTISLSISVCLSRNSRFTVNPWPATLSSCLSLSLSSFWLPCNIWFPLLFQSAKFLTIFSNSSLKNILSMIPEGYQATGILISLIFNLSDASLIFNGKRIPHVFNQATCLGEHVYFLRKCIAHLFRTQHDGCVALLIQVPMSNAFGPC